MRQFFDDAGLERFAWQGPLSTSYGCDRHIFPFFFPGGDTLGSRYHAENSGIFTDGRCYLEWIADQYNMDLSPALLTVATTPETVTPAGTPTPTCAAGVGDRADRDRDVCTANTRQQCIFANAEDKCQVRAVEGFLQLVYACQTTMNEYGGTLGVCPNNCKGVDLDGIIAGGTAVFTVATVATFGILQTLGLGAVGLAGAGGAAVAVMNCLGPAMCTTPGGQCCPVTFNLRGNPGCPTNC